MPHTVRLFRVPVAQAATRLVLEIDERVLDLSAWLELYAPSRPQSVVELLAAGFFERAELERHLAHGTWSACPRPTQLDVPLERAQVGKILALGKNFREHAAEFGEAVPEEPLFFNKLPETLRPHGATVQVPRWYTARVDHEAELAVVIGRSGYEIDQARAMEHVAGYSVANDLTARTLQGDDRKLKYPWFRAKNLDGFCPLGPCIVPRDWLDVSDLHVTARVIHPSGEPREELRQSASTRDLVIAIPQALAWLSRHLTLNVGDIVLMGTPAGVGPLLDRDEVVCAVERIGELRTTIARPGATL